MVVLGPKKEALTSHSDVFETVNVSQLLRKHEGAIPHLQYSDYAFDLAFLFF